MKMRSAKALGNLIPLLVAAEYTIGSRESVDFPPASQNPARRNCQ